MIPLVGFQVLWQLLSYTSLDLLDVNSGVLLELDWSVPSSAFQLETSAKLLLLLAHPLRLFDAESVREQRVRFVDGELL